MSRGGTKAQSKARAVKSGERSFIKDKTGNWESKLAHVTNIETTLRVYAKLAGEEHEPTAWIEGNAETQRNGVEDSYQLDT